MVTGFLIIVVGLVFKYSRWFQNIASFYTTKHDSVQFDMERVSGLFLRASLFTGIFMVLGELTSDHLDNEMIFWISSWTALVTGIGYFIFRVRSNNVVL